MSGRALWLLLAAATHARARWNPSGGLRCKDSKSAAAPHGIRAAP